MKKFRNIILILILVCGLSAQITVEKTIPQEIQLSQIAEHVTNVGSLAEVTIDVHLRNGKSYTLNNAGFITFWSGLTTTQKNVIKQYILQTSALAVKIDISKVTGSFGE